MIDSPVQFARSFEKLKSDLVSSDSLDHRLLILIQFWPSLESKKDNRQYDSYFDEYNSLLWHHVSDGSLDDFTLGELHLLEDIIEKMAVPPGVSSPAERNAKKEIVFIALIRKLLYVGETVAALSAAEKLTGHKWDDDYKDDESDEISEIDRLEILCGRLHGTSRELHDLFHPILTGWAGLSETLNQDRAACLFVEKDLLGRTGRGRLRILEGKVEPFASDAATDEITFDNQIKTPDDPFIGTAYDSLAAVRMIMKLQKFAAQGNAFYHAHFNIQNSRQTFTGDSIGLAFALTAYTQLLKPEIIRQERFLPADTAFTGGVGRDGYLTSVNNETLPLKIERAFFSPLKFLVVPMANLETARAALENLKKTYPRRRLKLIAAESLAEIIADRNLVRSEKVCIGQFVARRAFKYTRATKVQIPLLAVLVLTILAILFPKYTPWFDWRIDHIEVTGNRFKTINPDGHVIWISEEFEMPLLASEYSDERTAERKMYWAFDYDNDGKEELYFLIKLNPLTQVKEALCLYDHNGIRIKSAATFIPTKYPGDNSVLGYNIDLRYAADEIAPFFDKFKNLYILIMSSVSTPARVQIMSFDKNLNKISGPYIHPGFREGPYPISFNDLNNDGIPEVFLCMTNNRSLRAGLAVLDPRRLSGLAPPFDDSLFIASGMPSGDHLFYISFPRTELCIENVGRSTALNCEIISSKLFEVNVVLGDGICIDNRVATVNDNLLVGLAYILDSNLIPCDVRLDSYAFNHLNNLLAKLGKPAIKDRRKWIKGLIDDVMVYYGDSVVYHPASGIIFH